MDMEDKCHEQQINMAVVIIQYTQAPGKIFKSNIESAFANQFLYYSPHQGAKNLIRTVFPAVSASKLSGVSSTALAVAARPSSARVIFMVLMLLSLSLLSMERGRW